MVYFVYVLINLFLLGIFVLVGRNISLNPRKKFWNLYAPAIWGYTLILGLRYNRGADYKHYQDVFHWDLDSDKKLFTFLNDILKAIGINDIGIFFVYSFIFILLAGFLIKYYRSLAQWILPLFLVANIYFNEWFISQGLGLSFVFLFCAFLFSEKLAVKRKIMFCAVSAICGYSIHSGNLFNFATITLAFLLLKKPFDYRLCIVIYLFSSYYFQYHTDFSLVNQALIHINGLDSRMDEYIKRGDDWFSSYAIQDDYYRKGVIKMFQTIGECSFFYFASIAFKTKSSLLSSEKQRSLIVLYNTFVIGAILGQMFFAVEILKRIALSLYVVWCFPFAYVVRIIKFGKLSRLQKLAFCSLLWFGYEYIKYIFFRVDNVYTFIWDKIG